jgi:hypothetical protein
MIRLLASTGTGAFVSVIHVVLTRECAPSLEFRRLGDYSYRMRGDLGTSIANV